MNYLRIIFIVVQKDLRSERRSHELISSMLVFALISTIIFIFSFELTVEARQQAFAGTLWVALCFAGTLGLNRLMQQEKENASLDALLLVPVDRTAIFFGKTLANWAIMLLLSLLLLPVAGFFYSINPFSLPLLGIIFLGTLGYSLCGTLLSAITIKLRNRELFLPVLLFPLLIPLLIAVIRATNNILGAVGGSEVFTWLWIIIAYDVLFMGAGLMLFNEIVTD
jgi:heme exporter protein B